MARQDFISQLTELGYHVEERGENRLAFPYVVPIGKYLDRQITLGLVVGDDFPATPSSGPHVSPRLLPLHPGNDLPHPQGGVHESPFDIQPDGQKGECWEYWSRPFHGWPKTDRTVRAYMAFIRQLLQNQ
jgi:hypothetical protein